MNPHFGLSHEIMQHVRDYMGQLMPLQKKVFSDEGVFESEYISPEKLMNMVFQLFKDARPLVSKYAAIFRDTEFFKTHYDQYLKSKELLMQHDISPAEGVYCTFMHIVDETNKSPEWKYTMVVANVPLIEDFLLLSENSKEEAGS